MARSTGVATPSTAASAAASPQVKAMVTEPALEGDVLTFWTGHCMMAELVRVRLNIRTGQVRKTLEASRRSAAFVKERSGTIQRYVPPPSPTVRELRAGILAGLGLGEH